MIRTTGIFLPSLLWGIVCFLVLFGVFLLIYSLHTWNTDKAFGLFCIVLLFLLFWLLALKVSIFCSTIELSIEDFCGRQWERVPLWKRLDVCWELCAILQVQKLFLVLYLYSRAPASHSTLKNNNKILTCYSVTLVSDACKQGTNFQVKFNGKQKHLKICSIAWWIANP